MTARKRIRILSIAIVALAGWPGLAMAQPAAGPPVTELPDAASILDRYIEVTGGREAYETRTSEISKGRLEYAAAGISGAILRYAKPGMYYTSMEIPGVGLMEMGVTDGIAWERSDLLGPRVKSGEERAEALREAEFNSSLNWRELFPTVETTGVEEVNGEPCNVVVMKPEEGHEVTTCYSIDSGLALKTTTVATTQMGEIPVEVIVDEYKEFDGILTPAAVIQRQLGQEVIMAIDTTEANVEIPAERFALPADVKALLETAPVL